MIYAVFMCMYWAGRPELNSCSIHSPTFSEADQCQQFLWRLRSSPVDAKFEGTVRIDGISRTIKYECKGRAPEWQNVD